MVDDKGKRDGMGRDKKAMESDVRKLGKQW